VVGEREWVGRAQLRVDYDRGEVWLREESGDARLGQEDRVPVSSQRPRERDGRRPRHGQEGHAAGRPRDPPRPQLGLEGGPLDQEPGHSGRADPIQLADAGLMNLDAGPMVNGCPIETNAMVELAYSVRKEEGVMKGRLRAPSDK
jgi:hypothetical protein